MLDKTYLGIMFVVLVVTLLALGLNHMWVQQKQARCEQLISADTTECEHVEYLLNTRICMCWREPVSSSKVYILP